MQVFAYGSLMWRPGFVPKSAVRASAIGWSRRWCVGSTVHRGTSDRPGVVLGLVEGGTCAGLLYSVESCECSRVAEYLELREMAEVGYVPTIIDVDTPEGRTKALTYVSEQRHRQAHTPEQTMSRILSARGVSGSNADYAVRTFDAVQRLGVRMEEAETGLPIEILSTILKSGVIRAATETNRAERTQAAEMA
jgi:cation transport protein ChaC